MRLSQELRTILTAHLQRSSRQGKHQDDQTILASLSLHGLQYLKRSYYVDRCHSLTCIANLPHALEMYRNVSTSIHIICAHRSESVPPICLCDDFSQRLSLLMCYVHRDIQKNEDIYLLRHISI